MSYSPIPASVQRTVAEDTTTTTWGSGTTTLTLTTPSPHASAYAEWVVGTPTRITGKKPGYYLAITRVSHGNDSSGATVTPHVHLNGSTVAAGSASNNSSTTNNYNLSAVYVSATPLAVGDYFEAKVVASAGTTRATASQQFLTVVFIPTEAYPA